ncbi:MAG: 2-C-methyl-D-erythritol 4-phosphate cytidylyltransferase [Rhodocyclaceae bacterium]|nr:2-C-methyl-D-erythritol 4-phosphate cytidylyltransferase [Pseudomonadota bacterium]MDQ7971820.1 2-C-methyl-D-erythritol 4-phosphate cytidylyltransferase [Rhodocyclaceae bacterium]MDQ8002256.1 2-C-methyl-D-erythritol 4-phosphate cytidylyltransferase [Pseudomonadota bacterium]
MPSPRFHVLIPSAGIGSRAGVAGPKQYEPLAGQPLVGHTLDAFRALGARLATIALVVAPEDGLVQRVLPDFPRAGERLLRVGGATRAASVRNGLAALLAEGADAGDWVLVHDAARCLVTPAQIEALIAACEGDAVGGLLALPLADTLKAATPDGRVAATLGRSDKWLAQTPQMFRIGALAAAIDQAGEGVTDEASAIEASGAAPRLVTGSARNFKVTYPEDFALAAAVLAGRPPPSS